MDTPDITDLLAKACDMADRPFEEIHFGPGELDFDLSAVPPPVTAPPKPVRGRSGKHSQKISIRLQHSTLDAVRDRARTLGIPYQRLINMQLRAANDTTRTPSA